MLNSSDRERFERLVMPHLNAAFNFARWMLKNREDAEDVVQDAMVRAFRFFGGFHGGDARAWLLQIVRNVCYTWLEKNRAVDLTTEFDEGIHVGQSQSPESAAVAANERERLMKAFAKRVRPQRRISDV